MDNRTAYKFDVPVGNAEANYTMADLILLAKKHQNSGEYETARYYYERAASASYAPAKFHLARLLRDTANLEQTQTERFSRCEKLLLELEGTIDQKEILAQVCFELSVLYEKMRQPISCLAYLLRSRRYGRSIEETIISNYQRKICQQIDINNLSANVRGCYVLGIECAKDEATVQHGIYFLEEAVQHGDPNGIAALELADILNRSLKQDAHMRNLAKKYYTIAKERGNPDILTK